MYEYQSSNQLKPEFSVRIVVCDHYLAKPIPGIDHTYSEFRGADIKQVPVLRIFGPAGDGYKACLHIHGVFPYFYIPCPAPNPQPQFLYQIAASLDKALNIALKQASSSNQHVYKITLVKGLPFYGYHDKDHLYLKVFLYNPGLIKQAVELCSNGAILGQAFQPHESHLNFTLQFFIDFNLFGMSNIDLQMVSFRKPNSSQNTNEPFLSDDNNCLNRDSSCHYEADCAASHIINRQRVGRGDGIENPGLEEVWQQEIERRKQMNVSLASKSLSQIRIGAEETDSHNKYQQICLIKINNVTEKLIDIDSDNKVLEPVYYPAESLEGTQLIDAVDVSVHLPDSSLSLTLHKTLRWSTDETLEDNDTTLVDENVALNSSLHYSQVQLDSEDLELVDLLQDMDEKTVDDDSVLGTPANLEKSTDDVELDHHEYSQIFSEDTLILGQESKDDVEYSQSWNDSFWDGAINIPQLDGTFDDDHVKKVRKRKMRPFKLGLSKPKRQAKKASNKVDNIVSSDTEDIDEIDVSIEAVETISNLHIHKSHKKDIRSNNAINSLQKSEETVTKSESISDLVNKVMEHTSRPLNEAEVYDKRNAIQPLPGPSTTNKVLNCSFLHSDSYESSPENNRGITSFYDVSRIFDTSLENNTENMGDTHSPVNSPNDNQNIAKKSNVKEESSLDNNISPSIKLEGYDKNIYNYISSNCNEVKKEGSSSITITPRIRPPTKKYVESTLEKYKIPKVRNQVPYYSDPKDVGDKIEVGHMLLKLQSKSAKDQKQFENILDLTSIEEWRQLFFMQSNETPEISLNPEHLKTLLAGNRQCILEPVKRPPTTSEVIRWLKERTVIKEVAVEKISKTIDDLDNSQALGLQEDEINESVSLESDTKNEKLSNNSFHVTMQGDGSFLCFGNSESQKENEHDISESPVLELDFLTVMLLELHTAVRDDFHPDPTIDAIEAVFLKVSNDCPANHFLSKSFDKIIVADSMSPPKQLDRCVFTEITYVKNESELINAVLEIVKANDPDIMSGYEIEMNSWGYFIERAQVLGVEVIQEISRITAKNRQKKFRGDGNDFEGRVIGRIMFNVWRLFRHELPLSSYSFENCMFEILKERVPWYSFTQLSEWWNDETRILRWIPVEYYLTKLSGTMRMMEKLDIINRTSELARLFGLQWWEVLSRGSQFRVESLMLRAARPLNLIALSPTVKQRAAMKAPECLPLIFEPESRFYSDPVIVLDFQSLYPSMMIAYNYCFSTCIGRVQNINGDAAYEFGAWRLRIPQSKLEKLVKNDLVHWSPVGVGFVKSSVRRGVLPALLRRILAARQAVKKNMKLQTDPAVKKAMHSRQLGLKLIANVTYGYTAANFSGRMPCVEVGDSVVSKGRETLERAVALVRNNTEWNAKVIYGDTDSMFVLVPGGTRAEAFEIGKQIAAAVTADNPPPVALKLEKVYQPCILQTKKRYVGYMYETEDQATPVYEAKGIETVRRDGCPAGVKLLQRSLCELFDSGDMSRVKRIVVSTLSGLVDGTLPLHELFFTREYHGAAGYRPGAAAPPNEIAKRVSSRDRRAVPRTGERVPWLVCAGAPSVPLVRLARSPRDLLGDPSTTCSNKPHLSYYVSRVLLPPLHRCLSLLGADVFKWWTELGYNREIQQTVSTGGISRYMCRERCFVCSVRTKGVVCAACAADTRHSGATLAARRTVAELDNVWCDQICASCCGHPEWNSCENTECPVLWRRVTARNKLSQITDISNNLPQNFRDTLHF